jgi:tetrapyrrole methylase family protein/MazG family protein/ATP diphosphatase
MPEGFEIPELLPLGEQQGEHFKALVALMRRLLAPDGCPWDREQTIGSLSKYVLEEACEVIDAIDSGDRMELKEELGDLALQVVFISELARAEGAFGPDDVARGIVEKLVRRHPHVFGDVDVEGSDEVIKNWEAIKRREKTKRPLLEDIPRALPSLMAAQKVSQRAAEVGFDWPDAGGSRDKLSEELSELDEAVAGGQPDRVEAELGDVLFALVNLARHHGLDAERALRRTTDEFRRRFSHVEERVRAVHGDWQRAEDGKVVPGSISLDELDGYWNEAKVKDR